MRLAQPLGLKGRRACGGWLLYMSGKRRRRCAFAMEVESKGVDGRSRKVEPFRLEPAAQPQVMLTYSLRFCASSTVRSSSSPLRLQRGSSDQKPPQMAARKRLQKSSSPDGGIALSFSSSIYPQEPPFIIANVIDALTRCGSKDMLWIAQRRCF